jgi:hypothetical protein
MTNAVYFNNFIALDDPSAGSRNGTQALGVKDIGEIVGSYIDAGDVEHGFVYNGGTYQTLDDPNGSSTPLVGINDSGEIVGNAGGAFYLRRWRIYECTISVRHSIFDDNIFRRYK